MLQARLNTDNYINVTWGEKTTISNPIYLVVFELAGKQVKCIVTPPGVIENDRYEQYLITDVTGGSALDGQTNFETPGVWSYTAYAQRSSTNLDPSLADEIVENGLCNVVGAAIPEYSQSVTVNSYM